MKQTAYIYLLTLSCLLCACNRENRTNLPQPQVTGVADSLETVPPEEKPKAISAEQIKIKKDLLYDKYTLEDTYPYKDTTRSFQWDKIKERLALLENIQQTPSQWGILQNYKNRNGEAPLVRHYKRNAYKRIADTLGIERYQSVPLYLLTDTLVPERYGEDGSLVRFLADGENFVKVSPIYIGEEWYVPKRYVKVLPDTTHFIKTIMIDRRDQNIMTLEQTGEAQWTVRSMNPATTGRHRPPYAQETPLGIFVLQEKKTRMVFLKDGSTATGGFAPYASRFSDGGYIHGVPVNEPRKALIEYSPSLGTTPRSHMCVRNATSHSKFIFDWAPVNETIICFGIEIRIFAPLFSQFPMQKVFLFLLLFLLPLAEVPNHAPASEPVSVASTPETDEIDQLFDDMQLDGIVSYTAFRQAVTGYQKIEQKSKSIMTLIDFSKPSTEKRLYVLDMKNKKLLYTSVVSHGKNSGGNYATSFSNKNGSYKSSLGFYLTENTYQGRNGYSLVLNGLEKGINDQAKQRAIVMHGAAYANPNITASAGRLGRSLGCPALPQALAKPIIDTIKKGSVLFIYANNKDYLANSTFLSPRQTEYLSWAQPAN
jgi:hypothetical protein